jgi:ribonuclease III
MLKKVKFDIKLAEAKQAINFSGFSSDALLRIALVEPADLNHPEITLDEREKFKIAYRRLAFLGDALFDAVLADYLFSVNETLTKQDLDGYRQDVASLESMTEFAIDLGLPRFASSWNNPYHKRPKEEPRIWGEMFEAVVGVVFIDSGRDFSKFSEWIIDRFLLLEIGSKVGDRRYDEEYGPGNLEGDDFWY